jgi:hypothetical protein
MFRDEGAELSIEFKERMRQRVLRTPTSLIVISLPFLLTARIALIGWGYYSRAQLRSMTSRINVTTDLRTTGRHSPFN